MPKQAVPENSCSEEPMGEPMVAESVVEESSIPKIMDYNVIDVCNTFINMNISYEGSNATIFSTGYTICICSSIYNKISTKTCNRCISILPMWSYQLQRGGFFISILT